MALITGTNRTVLLPGLYYTERLIGTTANDIISGLRGDDLIDGGNGNDSLYGGQLNSTYDDGNDTILGGKGSDYLNGGTGNDSLDGGEDHDRLFGGIGNDYLYGGTGFGNDYLDGGTGNDTLIGGNGSDILVGGQGSDVLIGGNTLAGDSNIDWFVWTNPNEIGDIVRDFTKGLDKIILNASSFGLTKNNSVNATKPFSFSLATQSGLFTNTTQFHKLDSNDSNEYQQIIVGVGDDLNAALAAATAKIVAIIPNGVTNNVVSASLYYDTDPGVGTNYQLISTFSNGNTPTQSTTNTNVFDILIY
jgi:Ca2+-binding RTX toxin-like protein